MIDENVNLRDKAYKIYLDTIDTILIDIQDEMLSCIKGELLPSDEMMIEYVCLLRVKRTLKMQNVFKSKMLLSDRFIIQDKFIHYLIDNVKETISYAIIVMMFEMEDIFLNAKALLDSISVMDFEIWSKGANYGRK